MKKVILAFSLFLLSFSICGNESYNYSQKSEFVKLARYELEKIKKELLIIEARAKHSDEHSKAQVKNQIQTANANLHDLHVQVDIAIDVAEAKWDEVKIKYNKSMNSLKNTIEESRKQLKL